MRWLAAHDMNLLLTLAVLHQERSVTRAARRLGLTQPAVSHHLRKLRAQLDDPLFVMGPRGLVPTERLERLGPQLLRVLSELDATVRPTSAFDPATAERTFVVAAADFFELVAVPRLVTWLRAEAPRVRIRVLPARPDIPDRMERGDVDLLFGVQAPERAGLKQSRLMADPLEVLMRAGHPLADKRLTLTRYLKSEHVLIAPQGKPGGLIDDLLARQGKRRNVVLEVASFTAGPYQVVESDLLLTAPRGLLLQATRFLDVVRRPLPFQAPHAPIVMIWHERQEREPAHEWFRELFRSWLREPG